VFFAKIVAEVSKRRQVIALASKVANQGFDDEISSDVLIDNAQREFYEISDNSKAQTYVTVGGELKGFFARLQERYENKSPIIGIPSGLADLDKMTAGFQNGDLIILAARPSMGKTSLALNIATHVASVAKSGAVGLFSIEMKTDNLLGKIVSTMSRVDYERIRTGKMIDTDWPKMHRTANTLYTSPILIDESGSLSVNQLRAKARKMKRENDLKLIIIDYLQMMRSDTKAEARHLEISAISRSLKELAKELNIPIIALSQLNRSLESRADKRPIMSDLRESGAIEQDADLIMFIYRDAVYCEACKAGTCMIAEHKNSAEIIIGKQRNGAVGTVKTLFFMEQGRFESVFR
jgi:replicative DNA helicase